MRECASARGTCLEGAGVRMREGAGSFARLTEARRTWSGPRPPSPTTLDTTSAALLAQVRGELEDAQAVLRAKSNTVELYQGQLKAARDEVAALKAEVAELKARAAAT